MVEGESRVLSNKWRNRKDGADMKQIEMAGLPILDWIRLQELHC